MLRVITHIEKLLLEHDCVIVPDLGGFVLQTVSAVIHADNHSITPSRKEIVFNQTLQHNDGLLTESYMQAEHLDFKAARQSVQSDVTELKQILNQNKSIEFGKVGTLVMGDEGQIIFQSGDSEWLNIQTFGLTAFSFEPLSVRFPRKEHLVSAKNAEDDVYSISISRRLIHAVIATVAVIVLFLTMSTPVVDVSRDAYTASFVPTQMTPTSTWNASQTASVEQPEVLVAPEAAEAAETPKEVAKEAVSTSVPAAKKAEAKATAKPAPVKPSKSYYVVIASFPSSENAQVYLQGVDKGTYHKASIVKSKGKYRVYADCFTTRNAAESFIDEIRKTDKYKDAWLFVGR